MTKRPLKVLHLPINIASQIGITVRAQRAIGVDARGMVFNNHAYQDGEGVENFPLESLTKYPISGRLQRLRWWREVLRAISWCDVVHWHFRNRALPFNLDLRWASMLGKARIVEFWGSDIRIAEIASEDNPYIRKMYAQRPPDRRKPGRSPRAVQERFAKYGFECLIPSPEMMPYVYRDVFPKPFASVARLVVSDFSPSYPDPGNQLPLVVHHPSNKANKGSEAILRSIEGLRGKVPFEFKLMHGMARAEVLAEVRKADVAIGEVVSGDYGLAILEAMALGKPTICYIKPAVLAERPAEIPIVNANQDNLAEVLRDLLTNGEKRHAIGRASRDYVLNYHDAAKSAESLVGIYEELLQKDFTHA